MCAASSTRAGSSSVVSATAYVAERSGRRWITTNTSRVALTPARTRLMSAKLPYFLLADTPEGRLRVAAEEMQEQFAPFFHAGDSS